MKRNILFFAVLFVAMIVNAQVVDYNSGFGRSYYSMETYGHDIEYAGNIGIQGGAIVHPEITGTVGFITEHGIEINKLSWGSSVFVGIGSGLEWYMGDFSDYCYYCRDYSYTMLFLPVYATARVNFNKGGKIRPLLKVDFGYYGGIYEWRGGMINGTGEAMYEHDLMCGIESGVSFKLTEKFALSTSVGYRAIINPEWPDESGHQLQMTVRFEF